MLDHGRNLHRPRLPVLASIAAPLLRVLAAPVLRPFVDAHVVDFYAAVLDGRLSVERILARVEAVRAEARDVRSFVLSPNGNWRGFRPGQHVPLTVEIDGVRHVRVYSPSSAPEAEGTLTLTVKHHPGGRVSGHLHERIGVGDLVEIGPAFGDLVLPEPPPPRLFLIAGGSGITPLMAMLRDVLGRRLRTDVVFVHYARAYPDLIFVDELRRIARRHSNVRLHLGVTRARALPGDLSGRFCAAHLDRIAPDAPERWTAVCGPEGLIDTVRALWRERRHPEEPRAETFAPGVVHRFDDETSAVTVRFTRSAVAVRGGGGATLLAQAEAAGLAPPSGCRMGICRRCTCRKRDGAVKNLLTGEITIEPEEDIRPCVSVPMSDVTLDL